MLRSVSIAIFLILLQYHSSSVAESFIPTDFFDAKFGKLEDTGEIRQLSERQFQLKQKLGRSNLNNSGEILNFTSFCLAYGLAKIKGFEGWSISMTPDEENKNGRILTIVLLKDAKELADIPSATPWSGFVSNKQVWDGLCVNLVNPKYSN